MRKTILNLLFVGWFATAFGQIAGPGSEADKAQNKVLLHATAAYEDMVEPALANDSAKIAKFLVIEDGEAAATARPLPAPAAKTFENLRRSLHSAAESKDGHGIAANSAEVFKLLADNLKADALVVPVEVELMDYAGYKMQFARGGG